MFSGYLEARGDGPSRQPPRTTIVGLTQILTVMTLTVLLSSVLIMLMSTGLHRLLVLLHVGLLRLLLLVLAWPWLVVGRAASKMKFKDCSAGGQVIFLVPLPDCLPPCPPLYRVTPPLVSLQQGGIDPIGDQHLPALACLGLGLPAAPEEEGSSDQGMSSLCRMALTEYRVGTERCGWRRLDAFFPASKCRKNGMKHNFGNS